MKRWSPRPEDVERFTYGDCALFAWAINRLTGWPIHAFDCELHAFNVMPDGRYVDIEGIVTKRTFMRKWMCNERREGNIITGPWEVIRRYYTSPKFGNYSYERAMVMARRLLHHYGIEFNER